MLRLSPNALVLLLVVGISSGMAVPEPTPEAIVAQLSDDSYSVRQEAEKQLRRLGKRAVPALEKALRNPDPNLRRLVERLLPELKRSSGEILLDEFLQNPHNLKSAQLPGWKRLHSYVGDGLESRLFYSDLWKHERAALQLLETKPIEIAKQLPTRITDLQQRIIAINQVMAFGNVANPQESKDRAAFGVLILSAYWARMDQNQLDQFIQLLHQWTSVEAVAQSAPIQQLLTHLIRARFKTFEEFHKVCQLVIHWELDDLLETPIIPLMEKELKKLIKAQNIEQLIQMIYWLNGWDLLDRFATQLDPVADLLVDHALKSKDFAELARAINVCQLLHQDEQLKFRLRPMVIETIRNISITAGSGTLGSLQNQVNQFSMAYNLANQMELQEMCRMHFRSLFAKTIAESSANFADLTFLNNYLQLANLGDMSELIEGLIRPRVREKVLAALEQLNPADLNQMFQIINLCSSVNLDDLQQLSLRPILERNAPRLISKAMEQLGTTARNPTPLCQLYNLTQQLNLNDVVDKQLRPALAGFFRKAVILSGDQQSLNNMIQLLDTAKMMEIKEAVPLALRMAQNPKLVGPIQRAQALFYVGQLGGPERLDQLEACFKDNSDVGEMNIADTLIKAKLRDVALAVLLHEKGEKLSDYGFSYFKIAAGVNIYQVNPSAAGFGSDTDRNQAFQKYYQLKNREKTKQKK